MTRKHPKILVAAAFPPDVPGGSPWLFYQLLRDADPARISWWSTSGESPKHTRDRVGTYQEAGLPARLVPHKRFIGLKCFLLEKFWVPYAVRHLRRYIAGQKPDLLWIIGYGWSIPVLHGALRDLGIPYHMTVHDMANTDGQVAALGAARADKFQGMLEDLYAGSASRDVYTEEIADELERKTGRKSDLIIHCGAEPEEIKSIRTKTLPTPSNIIRIGYPGTIIAEETFARFLDALKIVSTRLPIAVEVNLFGTHSYRNRPWFDKTIIVEHGYLSDDELEMRYRSCDWGLAIMDLDDVNQRYNRFSFPCKFARALASALPVITIGHPESALIRYSSRYDLGAVMTSKDPWELAQLLGDAFLSPIDWNRRKEGIMRCVEEGFNADLNRRRLFELFHKIAVPIDRQLRSEAVNGE